jgi:hypothetical protein
MKRGRTMAVVVAVGLALVGIATTVGESSGWSDARIAAEAKSELSRTLVREGEANRIVSERVVSVRHSQSADGGELTTIYLDVWTENVNHHVESPRRVKITMVQTQYRMANYEAVNDAPNPLGHP